MAPGFPPAIEQLVRKHRLGTLVQIFPRLGLVVFLWTSASMLAILALFLGVYFFQALFTHRADFNPLGTVLLEVMILGAMCACFYGIKHVRPAPHYCLCTEGFLELSRGDPPTVIHALRWHDVTSTRRVFMGRGAYLYYVGTRHGKNIRIKNRDIWDSCNEHVHKRTGNVS